MRKRNLFLLLCMVTLFTTRFIAAATPDGPPAPDQLWQKAVEAAAVNRNLVPGNILILSEDLDDKGKVKTAEETSLHFSLGPDHKIKTDLVKVTVNGRDITAERQQQAKRAELDQKQKNSAAAKNEGMSMNIEIPFAAESPIQVKYKALDRGESLAGRNYQLYEYTYTKESKDNKGVKNTFQGTAWLDAETGLPVQIRYAPNPLPKYVSRMSTTVVFTYKPDRQIDSLRIKVEGAGGFLLFKKNMRMTMECSDYWQYEGKM